MPLPITIATNFFIFFLADSCRGMLSPFEITFDITLPPPPPKETYRHYQKRPTDTSKRDLSPFEITLPPPPPKTEAGCKMSWKSTMVSVVSKYNTMCASPISASSHSSGVRVVCVCEHVCESVRANMAPARRCTRRSERARARVYWSLGPKEKKRERKRERERVCTSRCSTHLQRRLAP